ncbi:MAG: YkgJ family cysteine cluster protein [Candidatus Rifleibacteriota bacterium]
MISTYQKIQLVESLQKQIDHDVMRFKHMAGIDCLLHCSECCNYPDIQASPLEFLPFAYHAWKLGQLEFWADLSEKNEGSLCILRNVSENAWGCQIYPVRGLICRLFGFSAALDKQGRPVFAACRILKNHDGEKIREIRDLVQSGEKMPVISHYYRRLAGIDLRLGQETMPINQAIRKAMEIVYFMDYRGRSSGFNPLSPPAGAA